MTIHVDKLFEALAIISEQKGLRATVVGTVKGGILTGTAAILGGLILGPVGLAVGGTIGGFAATALSAGKIEPVAKVLQKMPSAKKQQLYEKIKSAFKDFGIEDYTALGMLILSKPNLQDLAIKVVSEFLKTDMGLHMQALHS